MKQERLNDPTSKQREYLADLLDRAHKYGLPRLDTESFTRDETSAWIAFLLNVLPREQRKEEGSNSSPSFQPAQRTGKRSHYLVTPPSSRAPDGYRPAYDPVSEAFDHTHSLDTYVTEDDHDVLYCTVCSQEW